MRKAQRSKKYAIEIQMCAKHEFLVAFFLLWYRIGNNPTGEASHIISGRIMKKKDEESETWKEN